jgi:hypothetical protein
MARLQQQPVTREQKLASWKSQGLSESEERFLIANPELIDAPELTAFAANEAAQQGHARGSEEFMQATKENFHRHLAQAQAQQTDPAMTPTPKFFEPPPPKPMRQQAVPVSAPVSRELPSAIPPSERYVEDPRRVTLSVDEKAIAKASGITETEYARQKIRLEREKREGIRQ